MGKVKKNYRLENDNWVDKLVESLNSRFLKKIAVSSDLSYY